MHRLVTALNRPLRGMRVERSQMFKVDFEPPTHKCGLRKSGRPSLVMSANCEACKWTTANQLVNFKTTGFERQTRIDADLEDCRRIHRWPEAVLEPF